MKIQLKQLTAAAVLSVAGIGTALAVPLSADVIAVVDESGSMSGEHTWLGQMVGGLEGGLQGAGVGTGAQANRYGLTGFGGSGSHFASHQHLVDGGEFGSAAGFATATGGLVINGGTEDGWAGINYALNNYTFNTDAAINIMLVTDEDRDNTNAALSYASVLGDLTSRGALLNSVVNCSFADGAGNRALGIDSAGNAYVADGAGGFTVSAGGTQSGGCFGTTNANYVQLALDTGGAAWDLNQLRVGGLTADSFTAAFVDIKVQEIVTTDVPEPASLAMLGFGLLGLGLVRRRKIG